MRIIAGQWKGQHIDAPDHDATRPMLDRVRTVLFDMLGHRLAEPGRLPPLAVLDLFAGSGALGLEALSRGARGCVFVEKSRTTAAVIRRNLETLRATDLACVHVADGGACEFPPPPDPTTGVPRFDLVFVDPPYRLLTGPRPAAAIRRLLDRLATDPVVAPSALIVVRHGRQPETEPDLAPLIEDDRRDLGTMTMRFMIRPPADAEEAPCRDD